MTDWAFVAAAYVVILGGLALYAGNLARRLRAARSHPDRGAGPDDLGARGE
jgi:hypothetical protein